MRSLKALSSSSVNGVVLLQNSIGSPFLPDSSVWYFLASPIILSKFALADASFTFSISRFLFCSSRLFIDSAILVIMDLS